ncbi:unnamed protein product, partial [Allacma fusca]
KPKTPSLLIWLWDLALDRSRLVLPAAPKG